MSQNEEAEMKKSNWRKGLLIGGILIALIVIGAALVFYAPFHKPHSAPLVAIHYPSQGANIKVGETIVVQSTAQDKSSLIQKVELWSEKKGIMQRIEMISPLDETHTFSASQGWSPGSSGVSRLIVRAFNDKGRYAEAVVTVNVMENPDQDPPSEEAGENAIPPIGGINPGAQGPWEGGMEGQAGKQVPQGPGESPQPGFQPPSGPMFQVGDLFFSRVWDLFVPTFEMVDVEVEALKFKVQETYLGVFCYAIMETYPPQRLPAQGYFETEDQVHWNIEDHFGGENAVVVPVMEDQPLDLSLECEAVRGLNDLVSLGEWEATHPPEDWDGQVIQASGMGGEGFTVSYRINPVESDLEAPAQLHSVRWNQRENFHWIWDGDPEEIDGFRIYRDEVLVGSVPSSVYLYPVDPWWVEPPCGENYEYSVVAYQDNAESRPSNNLSYQGAVCGQGDDIRQISSESRCQGAVRIFDVKYVQRYRPGGSSITVRGLKNGQEILEFRSSRQTIFPGEGTARVILSYQGAGPITTDQLMISMLDWKGDDFYVESFEEVIDWTPGEVDLVIDNADIDQERSRLAVDVRNRGCATAPATQLAVVRESDGWTGFVEVPFLGPRQGKRVTIDIQPDYADRWNEEVNLEIDPMDNVPESEEGNNQYRIGGVRLRAVQFTKITVHSDRDKYSKGEWDMSVEVSRFHNGVWERPQEKGIYERWGTGGHSLGNMTFSLDLADDDPLLINIDGWELDDMSPNDILGGVALYHSPEGDPVPEVENQTVMLLSGETPFQHMGSWKEGGEYSVRCDGCDFTIHYRVVLER
jgi:hypothetical protein